MVDRSGIRAKNNKITENKCEYGEGEIRFLSM